MNLGFLVAGTVIKMAKKGKKWLIFHSCWTFSKMPFAYKCCEKKLKNLLLQKIAFAKSYKIRKKLR